MWDTSLPDRPCTEMTQNMVGLGERERTCVGSVKQWYTDWVSAHHREWSHTKSCFKSKLTLRNSFPLVDNKEGCRMCTVMWVRLTWQVLGGVRKKALILGVLGHVVGKISTDPASVTGNRKQQDAHLVYGRWGSKSLIFVCGVQSCAIYILVLSKKLYFSVP